MEDLENFRGLRMQSRIPPMIVCPYCQPGIVSYAGVVISIICRQCREAIDAAGR